MIKTYLQAFYRAFFSPSLYADVIRRWKGTGALYLLCFSALMAVILSARLMAGVLSVPQQDVQHFLNQIPSLEITKGELKTNAPLPYDITTNEGQVVLRIVDTVNLGTVKEDNPNIPIILTAKELIMIRLQGQGARAGEIRVQSLEKVGDVLIDRTGIEKIWQRGKWFVPLVVIPFTILGFWLGYFIKALVVAAFSYVVTAFMKEEYIFETRLRMAAVALTPIFFVNLASEIILHHKLNFMMMASMALLYIFVMIKTSRQVV